MRVMVLVKADKITIFTTKGSLTGTGQAVQTFNSDGTATISDGTFKLTKGTGAYKGHKLTGILILYFGTYLIYTQDIYGVRVDEDFFADDEALNEFCRDQVGHLEGFAQELNDSPWRETEDFIALVRALNEVDWRKEDMDEAIAHTMEKQGYPGHAFIATLHAHEIEAATPKASKPTGRRPGL